MASTSNQVKVPPLHVGFTPFLKQLDNGSFFVVSITHFSGHATHHFWQNDALVGSAQANYLAIPLFLLNNAWRRPNMPTIKLCGALKSRFSARQSIRRPKKSLVWQLSSQIWQGRSWNRFHKIQSQRPRQSTLWPPSSWHALALWSSRQAAQQLQSWRTPLIWGWRLINFETNGKVV